MNQEELNYALERGIISLAYIQDEITMLKRKEYLKNHSYKVWEGKAGKWRTYLPDMERGRRLIKRNTEKLISDVIVAYYEELEQDQQLSFRAVYFEWRKVQDELVDDNSVYKYNTDYRRYFEGTEFEQSIVKGFTEEKIKLFLVKSIKDKELNKKATKTLFSYIKRIMRSARINKYIIDDPVEFLEAQQFYKYCTIKKKSVSEEIVSDEQKKLLYDQFQRDYKKQPYYIPVYAVEFASLTGFRVAEISALRWECVTDDYIVVDRSEKYNRLTKKYYISETKNKEERLFPMTKEIRDLLNRVKKVQIKYGYICEWVFANDEGRIHAPVISSCTKNKCRQIGITEKGIHAYRKTMNSKIRCAGASVVVAAGLFGHSEEVNRKYYTFDVTSIEDKANIVSQVNHQTQILGNQR